MRRTRSARRTIPLLGMLVVLLAGCSGADTPVDVSPGPPVESLPEATPALTLVDYDNATYGGASLQGCGSMTGLQNTDYSRPVLIWVRLRVSEPLTLLPATYAPRSNAIDEVRQYLGPDPGPDAPQMAVSIGRRGQGPTAERLKYDTHLMGDVRDSPAGLVGAQTSWKARVPLDRARSVEPGDHYLFVEIDPATGGMDLHELTARWTREGQRGRRLIGSLSLRVTCGG